MPQLSSPLSTPAGMAGVNPAHVGKMAGVRLHFPTFAAFTAAITSGATGFASDLWADGQEMTIADEAGTGAVRVWRTSLAHARTVRVGGTTFVLAADTNVVTATSGIPAEGAGNVGDVAIDSAAAELYTKKADGWGSASPLYPALVARDPKQQVILFGDSLTANNHPNNGTTSPAIDLTRVQDTGYFTWLNLSAGSPLFVVANAAIPGNTTTQMLARLQSDVLSISSGHVTLMGGTNDILAGAALTTIIANLQSIADQIRAAGRFLHFFTPPANVTFAGNVTQREKLSALIAWIRKYCATHTGCQFYDTYTPVIDPTSATGSPVDPTNPVSARVNLLDSTHLGVRGAQVVAEYNQSAFNSAVRKLLVPASSAGDTISATNPNGNWFTNPSLAGTSGTNVTASGLTQAGSAPPNGFQRRCTGTITGGVTQTGGRPPRAGLADITWWQEQIAIQAQAGIVNPIYTSAVAGLPSGVLVGDTVDFSLAIEWDADPANLLGPWRFVLQFWNGSNVEVGAIGLEYAQGTLSPQRSFAGVLRTRGVVPAGATQYRLYIEGRNLTNTAGNGTLRIGSPDVRKAV